VDPAAGRIAILSGIVAAVGVVFLILFYVLFFATSLKATGQTFGWLNDICVGVQYLLAIPLALSLRRVLRPYAPALVDSTTIVGVASMLVVTALQTALVLGLLTFEQQVLWVSLALVVGVGFWLVITGLVARSTKSFPNSLRISLLAVPYFGYPIWAFWLGRNLLRSSL
jgi:hypothetical protein